MNKNSVVVIVSVFTIALFLNSCTSNNYKTSPNGLNYRIITDAKKPKAKEGDIAEFSAVWRNAKDSVILNTSNNHEPQYGEVYKPKFKGDPIELLAMMGPGDSGSCKVPADSMFKGYPLPPFLKHGDFITLDLKVKDVMSKEDYEKMLAQKSNEEYQKEMQDIQAYITKNNLQGTQDSTGVYVVIEDPGKGKQAQKGSTVTVGYTGMLLSNGNVFDSSDQPGHQPYQFVIDAQPPQAISGWQIGLKYFKEGGKGKLIVPSKLAYGDRDMGRIPPNSPLVFDIQLLSVK